MRVMPLTSSLSFCREDLLIQRVPNAGGVEAYCVARVPEYLLGSWRPAAKFCTFLDGERLPDPRPMADHSDEEEDVIGRIMPLCDRYYVHLCRVARWVGLVKCLVVLLHAIGEIRDVPEEFHFPGFVSRCACFHSTHCSHDRLRDNFLACFRLVFIVRRFCAFLGIFC